MNLISISGQMFSKINSILNTKSKRGSYPNEEPLRSELFTSEKMERFGKKLASSHKLNTNPSHDHLLPRLAENEIILHEVRKLLTDSIRRKNQITPAGEWLIDNFYLIEEHIRNAKIDFPKGYSENLPQLIHGNATVVTRIYDIILHIISHSDGRIDIDSLSTYINAYQSVTVLKLGELWAIPIMIRLALIENLRRVSARIAIDRVDRNLADYWAHQMIDTAEKDPKNLILVIADMARSNPPMGSAFVSELTRQLKGKGLELAMPLHWIEQQLIEIGMTGVELINTEVQKQSADQVSMSNSIGSLRMFSGIAWNHFVESHSIVDQILRNDQFGTYGLMDFTTRDCYRHVIEHISKNSELSEPEVAQLAIDLTHSKEQTDDLRSLHVGYYLIDQGVHKTKHLARVKLSAIKKLRQHISKYTFLIYTFSIFWITTIISTFIIYEAYLDTKNAYLLILISLLVIICSSQLAISLVQFFSTLIVKPKLLPRMDFSKQIPSHARTLVVIPVMLTTSDEIERLIEGLEVRFLANRFDYLHFGLLTDFTDAAQETLPEDDALIQLAQLKIGELNSKYGKEEQDLFYLFHRPRHWNSQENVWMGYERKRGKLSELNGLLRGGAKDRFSLIVGKQTLFPYIQYVITLDADTQLPLGAACQLIGTISHPLNQPWYDDLKKRVTRGYGIIQPNVAVSLPDITSSLYAKMHGNEPGIDPYTRASSDVYQDLFSEGSFIGKGIYDVDMFIKVLDGKFAENGILSHDLLEGCYVRSGLLSDVQLYEKYPTSYNVDMKRQHRWIRGDWQIFAWFLPYVPGFKRTWNKNPISGLSRWKIFDNLRRSLVPISYTALIIIGWLLLENTLFWTILTASIIVLPIIISLAWATLNKPKEVIISHHIKNTFHHIGEIFIKTLFRIICIPYEAFSNLNAIICTIWKVLISRKKLLEWNSSAHSEKTSENSLFKSYLSMWLEPIVTIPIGIYLFLYDPSKLIVVGPVLSLWIIAPTITWLVSRPKPKQLTILNPYQHFFLRKLSRKTWRFFEQFVDQNNNWLPPDNYQEQPIAMIAHRTSPTNIGLSLLSNLTAYEFGYINVRSYLERTSKTLQTMSKMERFRGHFFNWYDTQSLIPLLPKYISTVDSGNLVGHLLVLRQGLITMPYQQNKCSKIFEGLYDTLLVLIDTLEAQEKNILETFKIALSDTLQIRTNSSSEIFAQLNSLNELFNSNIEPLNTIAHDESKYWIQKIKHQFIQSLEEIKIYEPWQNQLNTTNQISIENNIDTHSSWIELLNAANILKLKINDSSYYQHDLSDKITIDSLNTSINYTIQELTERIKLTENLAQQCHLMADMEWDFLYNKTSHLFTIGYNVQEHHMDTSYYDLLASEARLCTFIGIAQGKIPIESWFALGRLLTNVDGNPILLSWSGSMFEYLMPLLVMPTYDNTLLDQTCKGAVAWQIKYGKQKGLPWGISESGYHMINANSHYQYRAFGAPGLGLKRGLEEDSVITPYATALALIVAPEKACKNLELMQEYGFEGQYGFYEAIDYTTSRLPRGQSHAIVHSYMAHHQAMSLISLAYLLLDKPMQKLFESEPQFKATLLLLQERIPKATSFFAHTTDLADINYVAVGGEVRIIKTPNTSIPEIQLLSNGRYHLMISNSGAGYSRWKDLAVTRWREDVTCDQWGSFCYIKDLKNDMYWSNTFQPTLKHSDKYEVVYSQGRIDFSATHNELLTHTEIVVSPEDDMEMRRVRITNYSGIHRTIEITSYAEVVLAPLTSDIMQPGFSNLFVQTEIIPQQHAIICTRRPRSADEPTPWLFHLMKTHGKEILETSFETDRMVFIGRGNTPINPESMNHSGPLSGHQGSVLDPIIAIRNKLILEPEETVTIDMIIGVADTRKTCQKMIDKYQDKPHKDRVFEMAWTHSQVVLRQINATEEDAQLYSRLASSIIFPNIMFRADATILIKNQRQQSGLWGYSISGDLPILLLKIENRNHLELAKQLIQAHSYWRLKGLEVDLVIWNEEHNGYRQEFQHDIEALIPPEFKDRPGGIFVRASDQISNEDRILFQTVARIYISDHDGTLIDLVKRKPYSKLIIPNIIPIHSNKMDYTPMVITKELNHFNGLGGFTSNGKEYVIIIDQFKRTPLPWVNVIANPNFGTVISESGSAYTWIENAHEMRITPWNNDPVSDKSGEAYYIRDEESGNYWSTTLLPSGGKTPYITRHGFGYSVFEHIEDGIQTEMLVFVDLYSSIKFTEIKIKNVSGRTRKLSATGYIEWVLGTHRMKTGMHVHTEMDPDSGAIIAKNSYNTEFQNRVGFFDVDQLNKTFTADRTEFIGRNGNLKNPEAMSKQKLSGKLGLALDPCAAIQVTFDLVDGEEYEIIFKLGAAKHSMEAYQMIKQFRGSIAMNLSLEKVKIYWKKTLGILQIETPDSAINILTNGWLTYQTISARLWGRSGFYQSGGAFGFRDQLQDVLSLLLCSPHLTRKQIILCASRQFEEGDVQHWWHPPTGHGVRTRCSDDYLWLPYATSVYLEQTEDYEILKEQIHFLEGRKLNAIEESYYDHPAISGHTSTLYEHCVKSISHGLKFGVHGLPLIGSGDWNDGFDQVGKDGKGESVWMAFFLYDVLIRFIKVAHINNDSKYAAVCEKEAQNLKENIELHAWDGNWYKRAWFDDGTTLGSNKNEECKIDSITQSWSVLSGAGNNTKTRIALNSAYNMLVRKEAQIIQLLDPPFDKSNVNPGYIKGYVPGVRENGGQYTHAAAWLTMAFSEIGDKEKVWELLNMINPINHGKTIETIQIYKVEPYVVAADIYARSPHLGCGGWTWYTGAAGWIYRLITESFLGLTKVGNTLYFNPKIPKEWNEFTIHYQFENTTYHIIVKQDSEFKEMKITMDQMDQNDMQIHLADDQIDHNVLITLNYENQLRIMGNN